MGIIIAQSLKNTLLQLGDLFIKDNKRIYLIGGAIRDLNLNIELNDLDFATSADPAQIRKIVRPASKGVYDKSPAKGYGTQGVLLKNGVEVEITPFRRVAAPEIEASPGQDASVTLDEDLASRDFTINAIAMDIAPDRFGEIYDPCGGVEDLNRKLLRTPRAAPATFEDDPLRILRAVRFITQFRLEPDPEIPIAVKKILAESKRLPLVALERVREEIVKMLLLDQPSRGFLLMREWGLLEYWLPEVAALAALEPEPGTHHKDVFAHTMNTLDRASELGPREAPFLLAALLHDVGKPAARRLEPGGYTFHRHENIGSEVAADVCKRLRFSNEDTERAADLTLKHHRLSSYLPEWTDSAVRRALNDLGGRYSEILALSRADLTTSLPEKRAAAEARIDDFLSRVAGFDREVVLNPRSPIDGHEVMKLFGISAGATGGGRDVGRAINYLKDLIVAGELAPGDAETARRLVIERAWEKVD
ncbi:MAG: HD domain-containing protein [bacterium]